MVYIFKSGSEKGSSFCPSSLKHLINLFDCISYQQIAALMSYISTGNVRTVVACLLRLFRWKVSAGATAKLYDECLLCIASCLDTIAIIQEKFK